MRIIIITSTFNLYKYLLNGKYFESISFFVFESRTFPSPLNWMLLFSFFKPSNEVRLKPFLSPSLIWLFSWRSIWEKWVSLLFAVAEIPLRLTLFSSLFSSPCVLKISNKMVSSSMKWRKSQKKFCLFRSEAECVELFNIWKR